MYKSIKLSIISAFFLSVLISGLCLQAQKKVDNQNIKNKKVIQEIRKDELRKNSNYLKKDFNK